VVLVLIMQAVVAVALQLAVLVVLAAAVLVDLIQPTPFPVQQIQAAVVEVLGQQLIKLALAVQA
jgi:hypothetical protein